MGEVIKMKPGKIDINEMKKKLNKKAGLEVAHSLGNGNDPLLIGSQQDPAG